MTTGRTPTPFPFMEAPIGVFDSGYGGLTILRYLRKLLPEYDFLYLGDNARAPYGKHSLTTIYEYAREAVSHLFACGCPLVIIACNTVSAHALRLLQQIDLPTSNDPSRRILGVIRPTVERLGELTRNGHVGILATPATVRSNTYLLEVNRLHPEIQLTQQAPKMWVSLIEGGEYQANEGVNYFVRRNIEELLRKDPRIDTIQLACTHYPVLLPRIREFVRDDIVIAEQGMIVAESTQNYLQRHPEMERRLSKNGISHFLTTEEDGEFADMAGLFLHARLAEDMIDQVQLR